MTRALAAALALTLATAAPAIAAPEATAPAPSQLDPRVAAAWSLGPAATIMGVTLGYMSLDAYLAGRASAEQAASGVAPAMRTSHVLPGSVALSLAPLVVPLTYGAGHVYAGDPVRGALVSLGAPVAALAGFYLGVFALSPVMPVTSQPGGVGHMMDWGASGAIGTTTLYGLWAAWDAYRLVEAKNAARAAAQAVPGPIGRRPD